VLSLNQVSLRRGRRLLFENVSFQVYPGDRLGLVGANGSGKTSLFELLLGRLETDQGEVGIGAGELIAHVSQESPRGKRTALDFVIDGDRDLRSIQAGIRDAEAAGRDAHELYERLELADGFTAVSRAGRLLHGLGFVDPELDRPVEEFSGGWRMRLNLAQALMCRSDILLLDEPTNHLDLPAILWLEGWLRRYPGVLLLVSHDRDFLDATCTRIAHIDKQQIRVYGGGYSQFEQQRAEQLALQQAMYRKQQGEIRHIQSYVDRFRYKASKARQAQSRLKMLERMQVIAPAHVDSPFRFHFWEPERQPQHLLQLEGISAGYDSPVLTGIDLMVSAGDRIGLLGANGAGKSTLVKALADGSTVLSGRRALSRETRIGYFAQHQLDLLDPDHSPYDHLHALAPADPESGLRRFLGGFGFAGERIFEPVAPFSGGEKARLVLALMIRQRPNLLLLDEPTNHLDLEMRQALSRALVEYSGAMVVISHDRHLLRSVCDELLVVADGCVERFDRSLDDYADWLAARQVSNEGAGAAIRGKEAAGPPGKRGQRQLDALRRQQMKPFTDRVRRAEMGLEDCRRRLGSLERQLSDTALYTESERKDELTALIRKQRAARAQLEALEQEWLEASEALETARG